jgi:hypothetical protein
LGTFGGDLPDKHVAGGPGTYNITVKGITQRENVWTKQ